MSELRLSAIYRYPLKSARGHALWRGELDRFGLAGDRRWMLVDAQGHFQTQRKLPKLALLEVTMLETGLRLGYAGDSIEVQTPQPGGELVRARVWDDDVAAAVADAQSNAWLSERLGLPLRLVHYPDSASRAIAPGYAPGNPLIAFSDGFPLLVISEASLQALNTRLPTAVPMDRFRPNLVIAGSEAHAEDHWRRIRVGSSELALPKPCSRCAIPSIDQQTAERDPHINRALAAYRRRDGVIYFGMNAVAIAGEEFRTGDAVEVLE